MHSCHMKQRSKISAIGDLLYSDEPMYSVASSAIHAYPRNILASPNTEWRTRLMTVNS